MRKFKGNLISSSQQKGYMQLFLSSKNCIADYRIMLPPRWLLYFRFAALVRSLFTRYFYLLITKESLFLVKSSKRYQQCALSNTSVCKVLSALTRWSILHCLLHLFGSHTTISKGSQRGIWSHVQKSCSYSLPLTKLYCHFTIIDR